MEQVLYSESREVQATGKVLAVDDSPINLRIIEKQLSGLGLVVTTASGGREALEKITTMEYDAVFMDHLMPEMDGIMTLHAIRSMEGDYYRKLPVVVLTANEAGTARETFLAEGFDDFLQKPTTLDALKAVLIKVLETKNGPTENEVTETSVVEAAETASEAPAAEARETTWEQWEQKLIVVGLDVQTALLYCGGETSYLDILQYYCTGRERTEQELWQAFDRKDWDTYTIVVHGIKSGLRSIGAIGLSEEARKLETAGRTGNTEYILLHHEDFMTKYKELFLKLEENQDSSGAEKTSIQAGECGTLRELQEVEFCKLLDEMEDAAYDFDAERFLKLVAELKDYRYKGAPLVELVDSVQRKLQKSDYLSAVEVMRQWKQRR